MVLSILKIIGIILLVILALLILILGILLFVPLRYQFDGMYKDKPTAAVLVKWTPVFLKVVANYQDDKFEYVVRMFGGVVMTNMDIPLSWIGRRFFANDESDFDEDYENTEQKDFVVLEDEVEFDSPNLETPIEKEPHTLEQKSSKNIRMKKRRQSVSLTKKIKNKFRNLKRKITNFIEKLKKINEKREALLKIYHHKRFEVAKKDAIIYIKDLWHTIKPKNLEGYIHFGFEDPATTGQALGVMAMFLVWYDRFLRIEPDFEKSCFDGELKGNGKFRLFPIVKLIIKVIFNKNLIKVIKKVQTIIES